MVTRFDSLSLIVIRCTTRCHSLYHSLSFAVTRCHSLSLVVPHVVTRCTTSFHSLSLVAIRCSTRCHSLSLVVYSLPFVVTRCITRLSFYKRSLNSAVLLPVIRTTSCISCISLIEWENSMTAFTTQLAFCALFSRVPVKRVYGNRKTDNWNKQFLPSWKRIYWNNRSIRMKLELLWFLMYLK